MIRGGFYAFWILILSLVALRVAPFCDYSWVAGMLLGGIVAELNHRYGDVLFMKIINILR